MKLPIQFLEEESRFRPRREVQYKIAKARANIAPAT